MLLRVWSAILAEEGPIPWWGQYGAVGVLLVAALAWWRYSVSEIRDARTSERKVWERLAETVVPVLGRAATSADQNATVTERVITVMEAAVQEIKSERSAKESAEVALLEERLRTAELRAEVAELRAQGPR